MSTSAGEKLHDLLHEFGVAMLVTRTPRGQLRARPMAFAQVDTDGTLWFLSDRHSGKLEEIAADGHVNVNMQSGRKFVSVSGTATPVEDREKVAKLWKEPWRVWFPGGKDDPSLVLLRVTGEVGEYWDNSGTSGIKYLIEAGRAYLAGTRPDLAGDKKIHGKVDM